MGEKQEKPKTKITKTDVASGVIIIILFSASFGFVYEFTRVNYLQSQLDWLGNTNMMLQGQVATSEDINQTLNIIMANTNSAPQSDSDLSQLYGMFQAFVNRNNTEVQLDSSWHIMRIETMPENTVPLTVIVYGNGTNFAAQLYFGIANSTRDGVVSRVMLISQP